uniref:Uncharacterized protein n=1 Tax=Anguilla anguilla TaxID=7936 RepID=A0A0E9V6Q5_ANGAN
MVSLLLFFFTYIFLMCQNL